MHEEDCSYCKKNPPRFADLQREADRLQDRVDRLERATIVEYNLHCEHCRKIADHLVRLSREVEEIKERMKDNEAV